MLNRFSVTIDFCRTFSKFPLILADFIHFLSNLALSPILFPFVCSQYSQNVPGFRMSSSNFAGERQRVAHSAASSMQSALEQKRVAMAKVGQDTKMVSLTKRVGIYHFGTKDAIFRLPPPSTTETTSQPRQRSRLSKRSKVNLEWKQCYC